MNLRASFLFAATIAAGTVTILAVGCGTTSSSTFDDGSNGTSSSGGIDGTSSSSGFINNADASADAKPCTGLCLRQVNCGGGATTSLSGVVHDPAGKVPLYNALVYVPNAPVAPIKTGASCERCGDVSGDPLVTTITDPAGHFKLDNVPTGKDIPLVVQIGKWRRQLVIPNVPKCVDTPLDSDSIRMPRNKAEGDLPQMAIASGNADPFECLLTKMGIDKAEFTNDQGNGRVHYYRENGVDTNPAAPKASTLYNDLAKMKKYDMIFLPCEGGPNDKSDEADKNFVDYTAIGGRVFTTHYGYVWLFKGAAPMPTTGDWQPGQSDQYNSAMSTNINTTFPKGAAFAQWLVNVNASSTVGKIDLHESRHDLNAANEPPSTTWMTTDQMPSPNKDATMHITFNTPIGVPEEKQCGRVVFSDFHVSASAKSGQKYFPASCKDGDLTAQEKALEFMLFDLSSCIQSDKEPPVPPPPVK